MGDVPKDSSAGERYDAIIEGRCPTCGETLERREHDGWCVPCGFGWAYETTGPKTATVSLTIEPDLMELNTSLGRFTSRTARVTWDRPVTD